MDALRERLGRLMADAHVPGAAVMRLLAGRTEVAAHGVTSLENPLPVDGSTLAQVGSVTKTFTATAIARLAGQGRLDLDAPVRETLPGFRVADGRASSTVTPRMLLTHTAGFRGDFFPDTGGGADALESAVEELAAMNQLTPAGAVRSYCNTGFVVLGRLVEALCGKAYEAAVQELVLEPAGMRNTWFREGDVMTRRFVARHQFDWSTGTSAVARPWGMPRAAMPVGGLVSCVEDLAAYARFHLQEDPALAEMRRPQPPLGQRWTTGLAWFVREVAGEPVAEHGGSTLGQTCFFCLVPRRGYAVAVLTNSSRGPEVYRPLVRAALEQDLGLQDPEPSPLEAEPERLAAVAGRYRGQLADYELAAEGGELRMAVRLKGGFPTPESPPQPNPPPMRVRFAAPDQLLFVDPPLSGSVADVNWAGDRPDWLRIGNRVCHRERD